MEPDQRETSCSSLPKALRAAAGGGQSTAALASKLGEAVKEAATSRFCCEGEEPAGCEGAQLRRCACAILARGQKPDGRVFGQRCQSFVLCGGAKRPAAGRDCVLQLHVVYARRETRRSLTFDRRINLCSSHVLTAYTYSTCRLRLSCSVTPMAAYSTQ